MRNYKNKLLETDFKNGTGQFILGCGDNIKELCRALEPYRTLSSNLSECEGVLLGKTSTGDSIKFWVSSAKVEFKTI